MRVERLVRGESHSGVISATRCQHARESLSQTEHDAMWCVSHENGVFCSQAPTDVTRAPQPVTPGYRRSGRRWARVFVYALLAAAMLETNGGTALAQAVDPRTSARLRLGSVYVTPTLEVRNIGVDTNVYNQNVEEPVKDFVLTAVPIFEAVIGPPAAGLSIRSETQLVYFANQVSERSVNELLTVSARGRFGRVSPSASLDYMNTRERLSFEIDARARHVESRGAAGVSFAFTPKVSADVHSEVWQMKFNGDEVFDNYGLAAQLNRKSLAVGGGMSYRATPLTTFLVLSDISRIRFDEASFRDTDTHETTVGVALNTRALISGTARIGYQLFSPLDSSVPEFNGVVGAASVSYRLRPSTSIGFTFDRRTDFSYIIVEPYYVLKSYGVSVRRQLPDQWFVELKAARTAHNYLRLLRPDDDTKEGHEERLFDSGFSLGSAVGTRTRMTFDVGYLNRNSDFDERGYSGLRFGLSMVYSF